MQLSSKRSSQTRHDWINLTSSDFDKLIPIANKTTKLVKVAGQERAIFKLFSLGVVTNRDEWVYNADADQLAKRVQAFINLYESERMRWKHEGRPAHIGEWVNRQIKWTSELEAYLKRDTPLECIRPVTAGLRRD
jgi:predicted helicase